MRVTILNLISIFQTLKKFQNEGKYDGEILIITVLTPFFLQLWLEN